jgi:Uma2 family endonuclease
MAVDVQARGLRITAPDDDTVLDLAPMQGLWTEEQYLKLTDHSRRLIEFSDGSIEVLSMPTDKHQAISQCMFLALYHFVNPRGGRVHYAPLRVRIREGKFREPDLLLVLDTGDPRRQERYWLGADAAVEIVSPDDPDRDTKGKRADYAQAGIPEYWIINPADETVTVLWLKGDVYVESGVFRRGESAASILLKGFTISVDSLLDAV